MMRSWRLRGLRMTWAVAMLAGCAGEPEPTGDATAASTQPVQAEATPPEAAGSPLTDRVWVRADATDLPGRMRVFLSDGTLLMDSCWEAYRLAEWRRTADTIAWSEDGREIRALLLEESDTALAIRLQLVDGPHEERYRPAEVPFVCPDIPR